MTGVKKSIILRHVGMQEMHIALWRIKRIIVTKTIYATVRSMLSKIPFFPMFLKKFDDFYLAGPLRNRDKRRKPVYHLTSGLAFWIFKTLQNKNMSRSR